MARPKKGVQREKKVHIHTYSSDPRVVKILEDVSALGKQSISGFVESCIILASPTILAEMESRLVLELASVRQMSSVLEHHDRKQSQERERMAEEIWDRWVEDKRYRQPASANLHFLKSRVPVAEAEEILKILMERSTREGHDMPRRSTP